METDRVLENELHQLECYKDYKLEAPLNHFSDTMLNDHLYSMYKRRQLETPVLKRKLVSFFVKRYRTNLEPRLMDYLQKKKLTLDD